MGNAARGKLLCMAYVYLLTNKPRGTLYVGVTNDLIRRVYEHRTHAVQGFTDRYNVTRLVWFEQTPDVLEAIRTEKRIKRWRREWKFALVEKSNAQWFDLYERLLDGDFDGG